MGFLRLFFALSVVIHHISPTIFGFNFFNSSMAVTGFFVISGFYMSLILQEKYIQKHSYKLFVTNRLLRIYPTYWLVLLLTLFVNILVSFHVPLHFFYTNPFDFVRDITLLVRTDYFELNPNKFQVFTIGPAWTLVLELLFYFVAPFIVKSTKKIILFMTLSVCFRYFLYHFAMANNIQPSVRFFPVELVFFLLGALSYKIYHALGKYKVNTIFLFSVASLFFIFSFLYSYLPFDFAFGRWANMKENIYIIVLFLVIPCWFLLSKKSKIDKALGDLSYPVYLSHTLVIFAATVYIRSLNPDIYMLIILFVTLLLSYIIVRLFEHPIDVWRQSRIKKKNNIQ